MVFVQHSDCLSFYELPELEQKQIIRLLLVIVLN